MSWRLLISHYNSPLPSQHANNKSPFQDMSKKKQKMEKTQIIHSNKNKGNNDRTSHSVSQSVRPSAIPAVADCQALTSFFRLISGSPRFGCGSSEGFHYLLYVNRRSSELSPGFSSVFPPPTSLLGNCYLTTTTTKRGAVIKLMLIFRK